MSIAKQSLFCLLASLLVASSSGSPISPRRWIIVRRQVLTPDSPAVVAETSKPAEVEEHPKVYSMEIESDIRLRYASTRVTSRVANPSSKAQETTFHVVLPDTAFISGFLMEVDGKVYKASVKEKEKAQAEYQSAVDAGQTAAQVSTSARDANQFTVSVNIEPKAKINFNLTYEELLTRRRGIYEHAIHVNPGSVVPKLSIRVNINEVLPITEVSVPAIRNNDIQESGVTVNELAVITRTNKTSASVVYEPTEAQQKNSSKNGLQGQFIVQYDVDRSSTDRKGGEVHVVDGYFVHFFAPSALPILPKHVVFVLDTSGSMQGIRLEQTKQAMVSILDQLRPQDVFSVVEFSSEVKEWDLRKSYEPPEKAYWFQPDEVATIEPEVAIETPFGSYDDIFAYPVTNASVARAKDFVSRMQATGSTNINGALLAALKNTQSVQQKIRLTPLIIFLTDGEPTVGETNPDSILSNIRKANNDGVVSVFSLAFGAGADFNFVTKISAQNKGFSRKIYEASDATLQLKGFFDEVASPLLNDVRFVYQGDSVDQVTESRVANYFRGSEFVVAGKVKDPNICLFGDISATSAQGPFTDRFTCLVPPPAPPVVVQTKPNSTKENKFSLEKLWAYLTIQELLKKREADTNDSANITDKALKLSLKYSFVTPLTSLLVVKPNASESTTDVRPADGNKPGVGVASFAAFAPPGLAGAPSPVFLQAAPFFPTTSSHKIPSIGAAIAAPESLPDLAPVPVIEAEIEEALPTEPPALTPESWMDLFETRNDTHATIEHLNRTLTIAGENETLDGQYGPCTAKYLGSDEGVCKSVWRCPSAFQSKFIHQRPPLDTSAACSIQDKYVGICCASPTSATLPAGSA